MPASALYIWLLVLRARTRSACAANNAAGGDELGWRWSGRVRGCGRVCCGDGAAERWMPRDRTHRRPAAAVRVEAHVSPVLNLKMNGKVIVRSLPWWCSSLVQASATMEKI